MENDNPYQPPAVETEVAIASEAGVYFHHRQSSRSTRNYVLVLVPIYLTGFLYLSLGTVAFGDNGDWIVLLAVAGCFWFYCLLNVAFPRVYEFTVGRSHVDWRSPWPIRTEQKVALQEIQQLEYKGVRVKIILHGGRALVPSPQCYRHKRAQIVQAMVAAVRANELGRQLVLVNKSPWYALGRTVGQFVWRS